MKKRKTTEPEIMKWKHLLDTKTILNWLGRSGESRPIAWDSYMMDYYAITECSFFRRLSGKTQVFTMDKNDSIRTRLTHSIEVATIAELLGRKVGSELVKRRKAYKEYREYIEKVPEYAIWFKKNAKAIEEAFPEDFTDCLCVVLRCAGLLHDIGNPPFGHSGERYIRQYFLKNESTLRKDLNDQQWFDLTDFEGNAQTLRVVLKHGRSANAHSEEYGMNLTAAVIGGLIKYPCDSTEIKGHNPDYKYSKPGYCYSENFLMNLLLNDVLKTGKRRNPIMLLMEAADNIAYETADLEDMVKKGLLSFDQLDIDAAKYNIHDEDNKMYEFQAWLIDKRKDAIEYAAKQFIENYQTIMEGSYEKETEENGRKRKVKKELTEGFPFGVDESILVAIYKKRDKEIQKDYEAEKKISGLLDFLIQTSKKDRKKWTETECEMMDGLQPFLDRVERDRLNLEEDTKIKQNKTYFTYLAIVDYVSGMTDDYFLDVSKKLKKISK